MNLIDFEGLGDIRFRGMFFSEDFKDSMERYLVNGLGPGGFATAMLAADYARALYNADSHNRTVFWAIAMWIRENCPDGSWGSYEAVDAWCEDEGGCRTKYKEELEKKYIVKELVG